MVSSKDRNATSMFNFKNEHIEEGLDTVESAVDIVAHKEIVGILEIEKDGTGSLPQI